MTRARILASNRRDVRVRVRKVARANRPVAMVAASRASKANRARETSETWKTMRSSALVARDNQEARPAEVRIAAARIDN